MRKQESGLENIRLGRKLSALASRSMLIAGLVACAIAGAQDKAVSFSKPEDEVPAPFDTWDELYTEQQRLNAVANSIDKARSQEGDDGFAGMIVDPANHDVRLYWKGSPPAAVAAAIAAGRMSAPVQVLSAPYSERELLVEAGRWVDSKLVVEVGPQPDGKGLDIGVASPASAGAPILPGGTSIPYNTTYDVEAMPAYWRHDDFAPYYGGGGYKIWSNTLWSWGTCSFGFAIADFEGYPGFLTAGHCGEGRFSELVYEEDAQTHIGWFYEAPQWIPYDIAFVSGYVETAPRMFTGNAFSGASRGVAYGANAWTGNWVNTSGANTGEHGGIQVSGTNISVTYGNGQFIHGLTAGNHYQKKCVAAPADSGGPVFTYASANDGRVIANGIISNGSINHGAAPYCQSYNGGWIPSNVLGWDRVRFVPIEQALQRTGAKLRKSAVL